MFNFATGRFTRVSRVIQAGRLQSTAQIRWKSRFSVYDAFKRGLPPLARTEQPDTRPVGSVDRHQKTPESIETVIGMPLSQMDWSFDGKKKISSFSVMQSIDFVLLLMKTPTPYKMQARHQRLGDHDNEMHMLLQVRKSDIVETIAVLEVKNSDHINDKTGQSTTGQVAHGSKLASDVRLQLLKQSAASTINYDTKQTALRDWSVTMYSDFVQLPEALAAMRETKDRFSVDLAHVYSSTDPNTSDDALLAFFKHAMNMWLQGV